MALSNDQGVVLGDVISSCKIFDILAKISYLNLAGFDINDIWRGLDSAYLIFSLGTGCITAM